MCDLCGILTFCSKLLCIGELGVGVVIGRCGAGGCGASLQAQLNGHLSHRHKCPLKNLN